MLNLLNGIFSSSQGKKWIYPVAWLLLVLWFLHHTINTSNFHLTSTSNSTSTSNQTLPSAPTTPIFFEDPSPYSFTANVTTSSKVAVIIETRSSAVLVPLILHFSAVLGPSWPIIIYTTEENFGFFSTSDALSRHQKSGRVVIRPLAQGLYFSNWDSVSEFLTDKWIWNDLAPAENILIFQSDSILCANAVRSVEEFFEWDLVGAPIAEQYGQGYNGGLSLRKRRTILKVLEEFTWTEGPEDQWYYARIKELQEKEEAERGEGMSSIKLPSMEIARTFAVESIDYPHPLGLHQPTRFIDANTRMISLEEWCPEYKLASAERISS